MSEVDFLRRSGAALYGERWQAPLARDLGVALRTVQRWTAGDNPIPPGVWLDLCELLTARAHDIAELLRILADAPAKGGVGAAPGEAGQGGKLVKSPGQSSK
jgi:hypothetical protein